MLDVDERTAIDPRSSDTRSLPPTRVAPNKAKMHMAASMFFVPNLLRRKVASVVVGSSAGKYRWMLPILSFRRFMIYVLMALLDKKYTIYNTSGQFIGLMLVLVGRQK